MKHTDYCDQTGEEEICNRIDPLFNNAFIRVFGSEESKTLTQSAINIIFDRVHIPQIDEIDKISAEHTEVGGTVNCKTPRFDVWVVAQDRRVDFEAERHEGEMDNRSLLYASRMMSNAVKAGESYKTIPQVVILTLADARDVFPLDTGLAAVCQMHWWTDDAPELLVAGTDRMLFVSVNLYGFRKRYNHLTQEVLEDPFLLLLYLLTKGYKDKREVSMVIEHLPSLEEFEKLYGDAIGDTDVVAAYEAVQHSIMEENRHKEWLEKIEREAEEAGMAKGMEVGMAKGMEAGMAKGMEAGMAKGMEAGMEAGKEELVARLRDLGVDEAILQQALSE